MKPGRVINVGPGKSLVRLTTGETITARNTLNVRTPPRSKVLVTKTSDGTWSLIGRQR